MLTSIENKRLSGLPQSRCTQVTTWDDVTWSYSSVQKSKRPHRGTQIPRKAIEVECPIYAQGLSMPLDGTSSGGKRYGAGERHLFPGSFQKSSVVVGRCGQSTISLRLRF